ncbi:MAG: lysophospholipid acyltransferase family protein [Armatimonadetes bacterium]|nr:lysophospholipid acyltransferase family protein [Armatimonadota bacterium]
MPIKPLEVPARSAHKPVSLSKRIGRFALRCATWFVARIIALMPLPIAQRVGGILGYLPVLFMRRRCRAAERNIARTLGSLGSVADCRRTLIRSCQNIAKSMAELFKLARMRPDQIAAITEIHGDKHLEQAANTGRGVIVVTGHFGNWELLGAVVALLGYRVSVVARDASDPATAGLVNAARRAIGMDVLGRDDTREMLRRLQRGEVLGILCDQHQARGGEILTFLDLPAATALGPALLALRTGAAIVPAFAIRLPDGRFRVEFLPALDIPSAPRAEAAKTIMQRINDILSDQIRKWPDQWLWLHRRWRPEILRATVEAGSK